MLPPDLIAGSLEEPADVLLRRGIDHQEGELFHFSLVHDLPGFNDRDGTGKSAPIKLFFSYYYFPFSLRPLRKSLEVRATEFYTQRQLFMRIYHCLLFLSF